MNIKEMTAKIQEARLMMRTFGQDALNASFKEFFDANPVIDRVVWNQYTPYFNDGESCVFGVNGFGFFTEDNEDEDYYDDYCHTLDRLDPNGWYAKNYPNEYAYRELTDEEKQTLKNCNDFEAVLGQLDDDVFEITFGDQVKVTATRAGFAVTKCDHE